MKWVRLNNSDVVEVIDFNPVGKFHPSIVWTECDNNNVDQGWTTDGVNWFPPEIETPADPVDDTEAQKLIKTQELAALRYEKEIGGIALPDGTQINTERDSQALINGAFSASLLNPDIIIDWKGENGWVQIDAEQITAIAQAVTMHVQACFTRERELSELIELDVNADITAGWPT